MNCPDNGQLVEAPVEELAVSILQPSEEEVNVSGESKFLPKSYIDPFDDQIFRLSQFSEV